MATPYEIAAWRFAIVTPFLDETVGPAEREAAFRERTTRPVEWPLSEAARKAGKSP